MKIKKFNNLWTMGLIIFGAILIGFYLLKFISPKFVISIAEIPSIVKFGNFVNNHLWAYYLFYGFISFFVGYFYCCACCRKKYLKIKEIGILILEIVFLFVVYKIFPNNTITFDMLCMLIMPLTMCALDKKTDIKYTYSTIICLSIHYLAQILSLSIRNIAINLTNPNIATVTVLMLDCYIWLILLYCFFNYKNKKEVD